MRKLSSIKKNPDNPRFIRDENFENLKKSIVKFPEMLRIRRLVIDEDEVTLGGNMRYEALRDLKKNGFEEVYPEEFTPEQLDYRALCYDAIRKGSLLDEWVQQVFDLTPAQKKEVIIKDNSNFGEYDWDKIANEWSEFPLAEWGVPFIPPTELDINDFFSEADAETNLEQKQTIILHYSKEDAERVLAELQKHAKTPEHAIWTLLGLPV